LFYWNKPIEGIQTKTFLVVLNYLSEHTFFLKFLLNFRTMKSLNSLKHTLSTLSTSKAARIKGGTTSTDPTTDPITDPITDPTTVDSVGGPWDNRGKRPGTKG
jgi:hypothetical protein